MAYKNKLSFKERWDQTFEAELGSKNCIFCGSSLKETDHLADKTCWDKQIKEYDEVHKKYNYRNKR